MPKTRWLVLFLLGAQLVARSASPQESDREAPRGVFVETMDVTVVNVEVYVTDRDGNRVRGLTRDDFRLFEDGEPVAITNFYAVEDRVPVGPQAEPAVAGVEADPAGAATAPALSEEQRLHLVVYVDNANIEPFHRNNLYNHLQAFLRANLTPDDRAALYTYERTLHLRQPFTSNPRELLDALRETETLSAHGLTKEKDRAALLREINEASSRMQVEGKLRMFAESIFNDMQFTVGALGEMIDGLAGLPGRKAVLYVSDGLPMRAAEDLYSAYADKFADPAAVTETLDWDISRALEEVARRANANRVTFYTIEAAGLRSIAVGGADSRLSSSFTGIDMIRRQNWQSTLKTMADETGGIAITGTSNFTPALAKVGEDFEVFYSLGYHATHGGDGRYHEIKVTTTDKQHVVRHRTGYRAKTPVRWMGDRTRAALIYDANANPLELDVQVEAATPAEGGELLVPLVVRIPIRNVTLVPDQEQYVGVLKLYLASIDDRGRYAQVDDQPWQVIIPADRMEEAMGQVYAHEVSLQMRPGPTRIAVGVRDELASRTSFVTREFLVRDR